MMSVPEKTPAPVPPPDRRTITECRNCLDYYDEPVADSDPRADFIIHSAEVDASNLVWGPPKSPPTPGQPYPRPRRPSDPPPPDKS
jgi:hypothetical protein